MKKLLFLLLSLSLCICGFAQDLYLNNGTVHIDSSGIISGGYIGIIANLNQPDTTNTPVADTWYPLEGDFAVSAIHEFSPAGDSLEYTGCDSYWFKLSGIGRVSSSINNTNISLGVSVNGLDPICCAQQSVEIKIKDTFQSSPLEVRFLLNSGDKILAVIKSDQAGAAIAGNSFAYDISRIIR